MKQTREENMFNEKEKVFGAEKIVEEIKTVPELYVTEYEEEIEVMKPFEELTFSDSFLFGEVMMDEKTCKDVLEIILGIEIEKVILIEKEKQAGNTPAVKSIRMDIYAKDKKNTIYNVEMQVDNKKDTPKRSRYYQGLLDTKILPSGSKTYNHLNKSFVIFICHFDPFGLKKYCYTFEERCLEELSLSLGDETQKIFLNTKGENRKEIPPVLVEFLDYIKNPQSTKIKSKKIVDLDNRVKQLKIDAKVRSRYMTLKEWLDDMCEKATKIAQEEGRRAGEIEGRKLGKITGKITGEINLVRKKYAKGYSAEEIADIIEQELEFVLDIYKLLQEHPECDDGELATLYLHEKKKSVE